MRVLALADQRPPLDPALMAKRLHVDAVVLLGDLDRAWIESLRMSRIPRIGVHGNHDPSDLLKELEVEDLHGRRTSMHGLSVAGFEGCVKYGRGGPHQYTQRRHHPRHVLHGHVHPTPGEVVDHFGDTKVHWVQGAKVLRLD